MTEPEVKNYQLRPEVKITPGADLGVNIMIESDDYKIWFEATVISAVIRKTYPVRRILVK